MTTLRIGLVEKFTRSCGECTLCCRLLPVDDYVAIDGRELPGALHKPAGERCPHQRHNGCPIDAITSSTSRRTPLSGSTTKRGNGKKFLRSKFGSTRNILTRTKIRRC